MPRGPHEQGGSGEAVALQVDLALHDIAAGWNGKAHGRAAQHQSGLFGDLAQVLLPSEAACRRRL